MRDSSTPPAPTPTVSEIPEENSENPSVEFKTLRTEGIPDKDIQLISDQLQCQRDANWGDLLSAAPKTLCSLGQCFVIAWSSSESAENMVQEKDDTISKYLRTNLVDCSDLGRAAFREAEGKLNLVSMTIHNITELDGVIDGILNCLSKENPPTSELTAQLHELQRLANECVANTSSVIEKFNVWQDLARKINVAYGAPAPADEKEETESDESKKEDKPLRPKTPPKAISGLSVIWNRWIPRVVRDLMEKRRNRSALLRAPTMKTNKHREEKEAAIKRIAERQEAGQLSFEDIENRLRNMSLGEKAVKDMRVVLQGCQKNLKELIGDTERLHGFFRMLYTLVGVFLKYHESAISSVGSAGSKDSKDWTSDLRADVWKLCVHYTIAEDISSTYVTVSRKYIMPGVNKVDSLGLGRTRTETVPIDDMIKSIADYSKEAQDEIRGLADKRRQTLKERFVSEGRVEEDIDKVGRRGTLLE